MPIQKKGENSGKSEEGTARKTELSRNTKETTIEIKLNIDKPEPIEIHTTLKYFDHMLTLFSRHAGISLEVNAKGDLPHHLVEDVAIVLGQCLEKALGDKVGIERYGSADIPMDESLCTCVIDLSGRSYFVLDFKFEGFHVEDMATEDIMHFFETLAINTKMNLHIKVHYGSNNHHKAEAAFKACAHALRKAIKITSNSLLSTKGTL